MQFTIFMVWMLASMVGSFKFAKGMLPPDLGVERLCLFMFTWIVSMAISVYVIFKYYPEKPRGTFRLDSVTLCYWGGIAQYIELLDMADTHKDFAVPNGMNVFYAILEDTDDPTLCREGSIMACRPQWVRSLRDVEICNQTDLLKIEFSKDGMPKVEYIGPETLVTAECKWEFIPGEKK
ncbi:hypothetical protein D3C72_1503380 [compost metagenome]